jgi:UDP-N-acetylglucosamine--N-acetylmuramyl-(pentapeptide) pyrophosphoryl-undecaprenol N-acetylglucosamine transferase
VKCRRFALVAGGGTAGHTVPALAVARAMRRDHGDESVELVGSRRGLDSRLLVDVEFPVTLLRGRGFVRDRSAAATASNIAAMAGLASAFLASVVLVLKRRPAVVVAVGGYACVAPCVAAWMLGVPVIVLNVDAVPGAANRLVARFARATAVAYPRTHMPRAVVTGPPVRPEIVEVRAQKDSKPSVRESARSRLGLPAGAWVVASFGGSLGARHLNEAVLGLAELWAGRDGAAIYHVVGSRDAEWARQVARDLDFGQGGLAYVQVPYEEHMDLFYAASDVCVCRAGANTVAELAVTGTPAVLVPLPGAPGDHQSANAAVLESAGAAVVVPDSSLDAKTLRDALDSMMPRLGEMASRAREIGKPDAADAVAALAAKCAKSSDRGPR